MLKNRILRVLKGCYRRLPMNAKTRVYVKDKFYTVFSFALKDTMLYQRWYNLKFGLTGFVLGSLFQSRGTFQRRQMETPGKIAVQLHLFYIDLMEDFCKYLGNMPFSYDLLVSIVDADKKEQVEQRMGKLPNVGSCIVRVVPNRGRDVAPLVVGFGDLLDNYEFVAHIHSKKSLYTGSEQEEWRDYLLESLFGSTEWIQKIFGEFVDNKRLGILYPRPAENIPYMAFTWLSNRQVGMNLLSRLHICPNSMDYFDFSAGTMFWARTKAIRRIYSSGICLEDFPEEAGQTDGTIAHAIERSLVLMTTDAGMDYYEVDFATNSYTVNCGSKSMWQYFSRSDADLNFLLGFDTVSFDVFDTLVMRKIARPFFVYELVGMELPKEHGIEMDFPAKRLEAEAMARERLPEGRDCTMTDIYRSFASVTGLPEEVCAKIRKMEVDMEVRLAAPRDHMVSWLKECRRAGKRIILTSDMYLSRKELERILRKCGIEDYDELYLSSETGCRKDNGKIWEKFLAEGMKGHLVHVGDNEISDWQMPVDRKMDAYHVLSAINLFSLVPFGNYVLYRRGLDMSLWGAMLLGVVLWRHFSDPMVMNGSQGKYKLKDFHDLGYIVYGPILLTYICWLWRKTRSDNRQHILFLARDGYFLQPLYEMVSEHFGADAVPSTYFLASRRSVTTASVRSIEDAESLLDMHYEGSLSNFFRGRFGIEISDGEREIVLPEGQDAGIVKEFIGWYGDVLLEKACQERDAYDAYIASLGLDFSKRLAVVDMGYAGTIQHYLSRMTGAEDIIGYYFATNRENRFGEQAGARMRGCFAENEDYGTTTKGIYRYQLLMEAVLTSPEGQLNYFRQQDGKVEPVYGEKEAGQENIASLRDIHAGVRDYFEDMLNIYGEFLKEVPLDMDFLDEWMTGFVLDKCLLGEELEGFFVIDDSFCNTTPGNVMKFYREGRQ